VNSVADYISDIVEPTIQEYLDEVLDRRRCFLACLAAYHVIDRIAEAKLWDCKSAAQAALALKKKCPAFGIVEDVALALKHTKAGGSDRVRLRESDVTERPPGNWDVAVWDVSRWDDPTGGHEARRSSGSDDVTAAIQDVLRFLVQNFGR